MYASEKGHTEAIKLLLAAPGIDVNQANVSLYLLTPSHLVVRGRGEGEHNMYPNPMQNIPKCVYLFAVIVCLYPIKLITLFIVLPIY